MSQELTIVVPGPEDMGPAMKALNERQRKFVVAWFATGHREKAAYAAGYAGELPSNQLGVSAYQVWHQPKVQAAIQEFAQSSVLYGLVPAAFAAFETILSDPTHKDFAKVAQIIADRTGFHAKTEHQVNVTHSDDRESMIKRLEELAAKAGRAPKELFAKTAGVTDADFEEVEGDPTGLEDLL